MTVLALIGLTAGIGLQDTPVAIPKGTLPKKAKCLVCTNHGEEKPAAGFLYKGMSYYFCNNDEAKAFKESPEMHFVPRPMPEFSISDKSGKAWNAESMKDKLILIDYWATWCGPCKAMFPMLDKVYGEFKGEKFEMLSVSVDKNAETLDKFLKNRHFPNPVLHDTTQTFAKWGVKFIPATFLIKNGQIVAQWLSPAKEKELRAAIQANLAK